MRCAQSVPKECQMPTQEHPTPTKTKGRNGRKTLTFRPLFDHGKRLLSPGRLPVSPPRHMDKSILNQLLADFFGWPELLSNERGVSKRVQSTESCRQIRFVNYLVAAIHRLGCAL